MGLGANRPRSRCISTLKSLMATDVLSTRQVATLLGVGEATVKRWADAGEIECFRTPGGHRKFRLRDVTAFVQARHYQASGPLPDGIPPGADEMGGAAVDHFKTLALRGDAPGLVAQLSALRLRGHPLAALFDEVAAPALHQIGEAWQRDRLSVAEEHVGSQAVIDAVARAQPLAEPPGDGGVEAASLHLEQIGEVGVEQHLQRAVGGLVPVVAYHQVLAQTPAHDLAELVLRSRAALVALSSTMGNDHDESLRLAAAAARQTGGRVVVGGEGMRKARLPDEVRFLASLRDLDAEAQTAGRRRVRS